MKFMKIGGWIVPAILLLGACSQQKADDRNIRISFDEEITYRQDPDLTCTLSEDKYLLTDISDFAFLNDSLFIVLSGKNVLLYSIEGEQIRTIGFHGRARGEMMTPSKIYVSSERIYIWCSTLMKMVVFDQNFNIYDEFEFDRAVSKFTVNEQEKRVYLYNSGQIESENTATNVIAVYDMKKRQVVESFGMRSAEDELMYAYARTGGIASIDSSLYYLHPATLNLHVRETGNDRVCQIVDNYFRVKLVKDPRSLRANEQEFMNYLFQNSTVKGTYVDKKMLHVIAETGEYAVKNDEGWDIGDRRIKTYTLTRDLEPVSMTTYDKLMPASILFIYKQFIYSLYIEPEPQEIDQRIVLFRLPIVT